ncbi:hypothetical protein BJ508DRAFT_311986 [Ascobolus immersus RN42]|uniref:Uncharacterized protein n=1 Tax=Ascobolus immersus RN42 TaxID=1160509 RepID=A0A3N4HUA4_ASCIM|nr:hypothetical protein BJ508DRAFT_311986 [Ascobolus immersus RN42]
MLTYQRNSRTSLNAASGWIDRPEDYLKPSQRNQTSADKEEEPTEDYLRFTHEWRWQPELNTPLTFAVWRIIRTSKMKEALLTYSEDVEWKNGHAIYSRRYMARESERIDTRMGIFHYTSITTHITLTLLLTLNQKIPRSSNPKSSPTYSKHHGLNAKKTRKEEKYNPTAVLWLETRRRTRMHEGGCDVQHYNLAARIRKVYKPANFIAASHGRGKHYERLHYTASIRITSKIQLHTSSLDAVWKDRLDHALRAWTYEHMGMNRISEFKIMCHNLTECTFAPIVNDRKGINRTRKYYHKAALLQIENDGRQ